MVDLLWRRANAQNDSFSISAWWSVYVINSVDKANFRVSLPHRRSTTVSSETNPLYSLALHLHGTIFFYILQNEIWNFVWHTWELKENIVVTNSNDFILFVRFTVKTYVCWPSYFWITRLCIMMWNLSYSMLWQLQTQQAVIWLATFQR